MSGREVHGLGDTFIEGPGTYEDGGRWVVVIRGQHVSTHPTREAARADMRARKDWCPAAPGPRCLQMVGRGMRA
jgi:hypothetical protein